VTEMDEIESCVGNLSAYAAVRQRLEEMVVAQQKAYEQLQQSVIFRGLVVFHLPHRVVNIWNSLPNYVVSANTNNVFKNRLDKFWQDQEIICDFKAQLEGTGSQSGVESNKLESIIVWLE